MLEYFEKTRRLGIFYIYIFGLTVVLSKYSSIFFSFLCRILFLPSWCVYAGCVYADFRPVRRLRFLGDRYHYFFIGKRLRTKATYKFYISDVLCPDFTSFFLSRNCFRYGWDFFIQERLLTNIPVIDKISKKYTRLSRVSEKCSKDEARVNFIPVNQHLLSKH